MLEMDVHLTKDQQVVVVHDWNFERTANSMAILRETNYKVLVEGCINSFIKITYKSS